MLLITIPPLIMFIFFQRQLVSGMTAGRHQGLASELRAAVSSADHVGSTDDHLMRAGGQMQRVQRISRRSIHRKVGGRSTPAP